MNTGTQIPPGANPRLAILLGLLLTLVSNPASPQPVSAESLTLDEAIAQACRTNLQARRAALQVELQRNGVERSRAAFYPEVQATARSSAGLMASGPLGDHTSAGLSLGVGSSINLFHGFRDQFGLAASRHGLESSEQEHQRTEQAVIFATISGYVQLLLDQEFVRLNQTDLEAQRRELVLIEETVRAGKRPLVDLYQQQAEVASAEYRVLLAQRDREVHGLQLLQTLGLETGRAPEIEPLDVDALIENLRDFRETAEEAGGVSKRSDLLAQQGRVKEAGEQVGVARAGYWPSLSLSLEGGTSYSTAQSEPAGFAGQFFENNPALTAGLVLSIPIFEGFATRLGIEQAQLQRADEQLVLDQLGQQIQLEVGQAIEDFRSARLRLAVTESQQKSAGQSLAAMEERYRVGASTLAELTLARAKDLEAAYNRVSAKYELLLKAAAIRHAQGDVNRMVALFDE